jgi:hypothetical protein
MLAQVCFGAHTNVDYWKAEIEVCGSHRLSMQCQLDIFTNCYDNQMMAKSNICYGREKSKTYSHQEASVVHPCGQFQLEEKRRSRQGRDRVLVM